MAQMAHLCPKCIDGKEVTMKRISVCEAISKTTVESLFSRKYMYLPSFFYMHACNTHEMRDTFRSEWALSPAKGVAAEFFMGMHA